MKAQGEYYYEKVLETIKKIPGLPIVEIGTDKGTTAVLAMNALRDNNDKRWFFTIDPYGDKPYKAGGDLQNSMGYDDSAYLSTISALYKKAHDNKLNYLHWKLMSLDFIKMFPEVQFWSGGRVLPQQFAFAFLDGDHHWNPVFEEFMWFYERMPEGGVICIDDYNLIGGETEVRQRITVAGDWFFNEADGHYRCYFTKCTLKK